MEATDPVPKSLFSREVFPFILATLTTVSLAAFDGISVVVALPSITADLGSPELLPWVITAFLLASAIATLAAGPAIDRFGIRRAFRFTVIAFALTSGACALAPSMALLVVFRIMQGLGGGLVIALSLAAIGIVIPTELRARAYVSNSFVWGFFALSGPVIASALTGAIGWRSIFLVNVPLCVLALAVGWHRFPGHVPNADKPKFDYLGLGLLAAFTSVTLLGLSRFDVWALLALAGAGGLGWAYWRHSGRIENPVLERRFFASPPFLMLNLVASAAYGAGVGLTSYFPVYVEGGLGRGAAAVSLGMLMFSAGWLIGSVAASRILDHLAPIPTSTIGVLLATLSSALTATIAGIDPPTWLIGLTFLGVGTGIGLISPSMLLLLQSRTEKRAIGRATSAHQYVRTLGLTFATGLMGAVLLGVVQVQLGDTSVVEGLLSGKDVETSTAAENAIVDGYRAVSLLGFVVIAASIIGLVVLWRWSRSHAATLAVEELAHIPPSHNDGSAVNPPLGESANHSAASGVDRIQEGHPDGHP